MAKASSRFSAQKLFYEVRQSLFVGANQGVCSLTGWSNRHLEKRAWRRISYREHSLPSQELLSEWPIDDEPITNRQRLVVNAMSDVANEDLHLAADQQRAIQLERNIL